MSVKSLSPQRRPFEAGVYLGDLLEHGNGSGRFRLFRDRIWPELRRLEPELQAMYTVDNGRPGESPVRLLGVSILQFMERLADRQAVEALTSWSGDQHDPISDLRVFNRPPNPHVRFREPLSFSAKASCMTNREIHGETTRSLASAGELRLLGCEDAHTMTPLCPQGKAASRYLRSYPGGYRRDIWDLTQNRREEDGNPRQFRGGSSFPTAIRGS